MHLEWFPPGKQGKLFFEMRVKEGKISLNVVELNFCFLSALSKSIYSLLEVV